MQPRAYLAIIDVTQGPAFSAEYDGRMAGIDEAVRVRYAPSPTGALHLGGARTALFNYLFARQKHGQFLLRIEDTDRARFKPDSQAAIEEGLRWLDMNWDEPPMIQSQRKQVYTQAADVLLELGAAYRCFCTPQRLEQMRADQRARHEPERYDRRCRSIPRAESDRRAASGERFVIRQAIPTDGTTTFHDLVLGTVTFRNDTLDDHVLLKSDGFPTYHLAFAVDDHAMAISHIIRGDGWLPSAPKHLLLFQAFNWLPPAFAHLPLVPLVRERLRTLNEAPDMLRFFFEEPDSYRPEQLTPKGHDANAAAAALKTAASTLNEVSEWTPEFVEPALRELAERIGWSSRDLFMLLRVAITGRTVTPPLIESMSRLGKDRVLARLERAATALADP